MPIPLPTEDELVSTLIHSSIPTVLVEGVDDQIIYRWIGKEIGVLQADFVPCGGRSVLLKVHSRKHEFAKLKTAFIADRDMWLFTTIPSIYSDIIWTSGYSIENDLFFSSKIEDFLYPDEISNFRKTVELISTWFAFEVEQFRNSNSINIDIHINEVIKPNTYVLCPNFIRKRSFTEPDQAKIDEVLNNYNLYLRGKMLTMIMERFLGKPKRAAQFNYGVIIETALRTGDNAYLIRIMNEVKAKLAI